MDWGDTLFVIALITIATITVIGNIVVILAVVSNRPLQNPSNFLMVNLAVSDFFQGALTMPLRLAEVLNTSNHNLIRCDLVISLTILFHSASNFNLALIALDRFIAVSKPFAYANVVKTSSYKIVIALSWLCCVILSGGPIVGWRKDTPENAGSICRYGTTLTEEYIIMYVCVVDVAPVVIMLVTYTYIFRTTRRQINQIRAQEIAVKHAAINQACEYRRASDTNAWGQSQFGTEDRQPAAADHSMNPENGSAVRSRIVHVNPIPPEEDNAREASNNNNKDLQNEPKESVSPQTSNNRHVSLSTIRTDNLTPIHPEMSSTGEISNNNYDCNGVKTRVTPRNSNNKNLPLSTTRTRKATRTVLAIIGFFIVLCMPITVIDAIELWCKSCGQIPPAVITIALCMVSSNSSVNVFVYGGYNTDYRKAYWKIWHRTKGAFLNIFTRTKSTVQSAQTASSAQ